MSMFIVEGANGSGKTSLINSLKDDGYKTLSSPNGTPLAKYLRSACRGTDQWTDIDPKVQFMLFSAARYDEYLRCIHGSKDIIFTDRWWTSTYVYQCLFGGISVDFLENTIHAEEKIDMVFILDAKNETLLSRVKTERELNSAHGKCKWTQDTKDQETIMNLYRNNLKPYLEKRGIHCMLIDTESLSKEQVKDVIIKNVKIYCGR